MAWSIPGSAAAEPVAGVPAPRARRRVGGRPLRRFARNPLSVAGGLVVLVLLLAAAVPGGLAPFPEDAGPSVHFDRTFQPPGPVHWFGTDEVGRDVFSRAVFGARVSLTLAVVVLGTALAVGVPLGLYAGYREGARTSGWVMRVTDVFLSVPPLALALAAAAAVKPDLTGAAVAISFTWWPWYARLVYGEVLVRREEP
jgi:peptide/nickel transport system permease protein